MRGRIVAIGGSIVAVAAGSIVAVSVTASSGGTTAAQPPSKVVEPVVQASASPTGPDWSVSPSASPSPSATTAAAAASSSPAAAKSGTITYVVKPGDNLSVISAWFHLHGYGALYDANRSVIGTNPDLIFPGERITISHGTLTTSSR
jgi:nucleoid-associated protein YgaU